MKKMILMSLILISGMSLTAQNCIEILPGTTFVPTGNNTYSLVINYQTDGNKTLETIIKCGTDTILVDCFRDNNAGLGTKTYTGLSCSSLAGLSATFVRRTGSCNAAKCGPDVLLGNGVLAMKYGFIKARNSGNNTIITFQASSTEDTNELTFNLMYPKNVVKKYKVILMDRLSMSDTWQVTINNLTKQYTITKL